MYKRHKLCCKKEQTSELFFTGIFYRLVNKTAFGKNKYTYAMIKHRSESATPFVGLYTSSASVTALADLNYRINY